jgi:twinkle protein
VTSQEFAERYLQPFKIQENKVQPKFCPFCKGGTHHDTYTSFLDLGRKHFECMRGSCGVQMTLNELAQHFGETLEPGMGSPRSVQKEYVRPKAKVKAPPDPMVQYWAARRISKATLTKAKVVSDLKGNIVFPYFFNDELVLVKYKLPRDPLIVDGKKERKNWQEPDGMPVLWGIDELPKGNRTG